MKKDLAVILMFIILPSAGGVMAQEIEKVSEQEAKKPYQIVITPTLSRAGLRDLIAGVEEDFYEKFNELNLEDNYDIVCYKYTPTMSHISKRVCEPIFMYKTRGDIASMATFLLGAGGVTSSARASSSDYMESERQLARERRRDYQILQELMEEFTQTNSEFREIGEVLAELKRRLDNYGDTQ